MGSTRGPYREEFPVGTFVRIRELPVLERFRETWRLHHPLTDEQLACAEREAKVVQVGFYHGGDELYSLDGIPGFWHECCLTAPGDSTAPACGRVS